MPILPLIDLLLLLGTGSLFVGFLLKTIAITTRFHPNVLGFTSIDFVLIAGVCLGLSLVLAARTWVKLNEPKLLALRQEDMEERFRREQRLVEKAAAEIEGEVPEGERLGPVRAQGRREAMNDR